MIYYIYKTKNLQVSKSFKLKSGLFFLLLLFLPYCYLAFFSNPIAEDFGFAFQFQENESFYELLKNSYLTMNGRYVSNIFMYASPIAFNSFVGYKVFPFVLILLLLIGNFIFVQALKICNGKSGVLVLSSVLTLLFLNNMPIISEGIYWHTGSSIYVLGLIFSLFFLWSILKLFTYPYRHINFVLSTLLLFLSCGFNEVLTLLLVFFLMVFCLVMFLLRNKGKNTALFLFLFSIVFASFMIFAPGNSYREGMYPLKGDLGHTFLMSFLQLCRFGFLWTFSLPLIAASVLFYRFIGKLKHKPSWLISLLQVNKWLILSLLPIIILLCVIPPYWYTGILGQHRTLNIAYFFFIIVWFLNVAVWFGFLEKKGIKLNFKLPKKVCFILLVASLLFTGNGFNGLSDIFSGDANNFDKQMKNRHAILINNQENPPKEIVLKPIVFMPKTLFVMDISADPNYWTNQGYNGFFKLPYTLIYTEEIKQ
ncbi:MAG: DUF6056 family protein [Vicingaceae bacterium]|nr:DUF6056 family protein [Vicingaceae bacterium]